MVIAVDDTVVKGILKARTLSRGGCWFGTRAVTWTWPAMCRMLLRNTMNGPGHGAALPRSCEAKIGAGARNGWLAGANPATRSVTSPRMSVTKLSPDVLPR